MEGVAARKASNGEPAAPPGAVQAQAFRGVARARRLEATHRSEQLGQCELVDADQKDERLRQHRLSQCAAEAPTWLGLGLRFGRARRWLEQGAQAPFDLRASGAPLGNDAGELALARGSLDDHHEVDPARPQLTRRAKGFANQALGTASDDGISDATRRRDAQARRTRRRARRKNQDEPLRGDTLPTVLNTQELGAFADTRACREAANRGAASRENTHFS